MSRRGTGSGKKVQKIQAKKSLSKNKNDNLLSAIIAMHNKMFVLN